MKNNFYLILIILFAISCTQSKTVNLYDESKTNKIDTVLVSMSNDIEIMKLDDKPVSTPMTNNNLDLYIAKGEHSFTLRYYCLWKSNNGDNNLIKSKKVTISGTLEKNKTYQISHKKIVSYDDALAMEKEPIFTLKESSVTAITKPAPNNSEPAKTTKTENSQTPATDKKSLDVLKLIWENSSDEDKRKFLEWVETSKK